MIMSDELSCLNWILQNSIDPKYEVRATAQEYGDLSELNQCRRIRNAAGRQTLADIAREAICLLDTSVAIYEENGDYAFGMFASGWCRLLDSASRRLCDTRDNRQALACGKWLCHENCWNDAAKKAMDSGRPADIECVGGIRLYAEPVFASGRVVGSINIGYGNPPRDVETLEMLACRFNVSVDELRKAARQYMPRPGVVVDMAKNRLKTAARLLGQMVERRQQEEDLLASRRRMSTLLQNLPGMAYRCRNEKKWTMEFVSQGCFALTGYESGHLTGEGGIAYGDLIDPEDVDDVWQKVQQSLARNRHFEVEYRIVTASGDIRWVWERGVATGRTDNGLEIIEGFISDITERKKAEEKHGRLEKQLHQSRRMEAMGRFAGGIAHDFNNLLFVILGYSEMMLQDLPETHDMQGPVREIYNAADKGRDLIGQILAFSRRQMPEMEIIDVERIIGGIETMLARLIGEDIEIQVSLGAGAGYVKAHASQIEQILMNLAVNARDAMPSGGRLFIATGAARIEKDNEEAEIGELRPGPYFLITVEDTGEGMDRDTLDRIFEPFFSTKSRENGSGLGLSTVYGIVGQYGGKVRVSSQPGQGTRFLIYLPLVETARDSDAAGPQEETESRGLNAAVTVLVVEDDPSVRELAIKILKDQGCRVIETRDGSDAVEKAQSLEEPLHLLLTDVVMPGMKGPEVFRRIRARHPEMKVLYMSGYSGNVLEETDMPRQKAAFLQKPFTIQELRGHLAMLLGDRTHKGGQKPTGPPAT